MPLFTTAGRHRGINTGLHYSLLGGRITVGECVPCELSLVPCSKRQQPRACRAGLEERAGQLGSDTGPARCAAGLACRVRQIHVTEGRAWQVSTLASLRQTMAPTTHGPCQPSSLRWVLDP